MKDKKLEYVFCVLFGGYIAAVLWLTLFSRIGTEIRNFLLPFHSYVEISKGDWSILLENIGNVAMFLPLGIALKCVEIKEIRRALIGGLISSLCIETLQFIFALGTFEIDDLLHNTLGVVSGFWLVSRVNGKIEINLSSRLKRVILLSMLLSISILLSYGEVQHQRMVKYASINDREDGTENLLVLNGKSGNAWGTGVYVKYLNDGSIRIKGTSDKTSWWLIGEITLEPGAYSFSGLSGMKNETVGLELETDNKRFTQDVGPIDEVRFTLCETKELKVYVIVYDGCDCDVIARPAIYKEE